MSRILEDWLLAYVKYTEDSEPPQSYHVWTGMAIIAGVLQRKIYLNWGRSVIYPNLYIVLVGPSGRAKKGTALEYAKPLLNSVGVKVVEGAVTREALIRRMSGAINNFTDNTTGEIKFQCAVTCISDELSVFLGQQNVKFLADLCNWYDTPSFWRYDTKNMGTDTLDGVCFNLLAATAPDWLPSILPKEAVGGGFTSRVIWIVEEDKGKSVVFPAMDKSLEEALLHDLEQIMLVSGECVLSPDAKDWYEKWYLGEEAMAAKGHLPILDPKMAGYCERRATLIKKLAMIISLSEDSQLVIEVRHFNRVLSLLEPAEARMPRVFRGLGSARYVYATELISNFIAKHKVVTRSQILKFFFRDIDSHTFDTVVITLEEMGVVRVVRKPANNEVILELVEGKLGWQYESNS